MAITIDKMLRAIINGQSASKDELLHKMAEGNKSLKERIDKLDKKLTTRIDKLGRSLAYLEDDAPTIEEFDKLEKRVKKVEVKVASI